ncbi:DnaJ-domain-containing protein [Dissoconium aciculare CBS 342.82]|uniref:DnaJ-domain-containing protein n=1 Tax=Dissoconium aciculare CBS 342.82 TaxID=1314786 RepID=A0A6J3M2E2_9PEZI|nr:DnaJ-domain-containing protein [Dissoconium aciculare CBS 342.82]KAF1822078.1 DnaJ-domain-containing protein [Dissoconium aciculare CBS 342.82]
MPKRQRDEEIEAGEAPTDINPYFILSIEETATQDEIKKAYRRAALKHHPDKAAPEDKETAHTKFQEIAFAFAILSDERRRKRYDTTGRTEESLDLDDDDFDWTSFFREQFADVVSREAIENFSGKYKGGDEERRDLLRFYTKHKGNMVKIYQEVILSDMTEDEDRFRAIIDQAIKDDEVEAFTKYTEESENSRRKRIQRAQKQKEEEAVEAVELEEEIKEKANKKKQTKKTKEAGGMADLAALIQQRQKDRQGNFFANIEAKYAPKGKKNAKQDPMDEPSEEAFARNAKKSSNGDASAGASRTSKRVKK